MSEELGFNVYKVNMGGKAHRYVSPLPMAIVAKHGLVAEAIVGEVTGDAEGVTSENFKARKILRLIRRLSSSCSGQFLATYKNVRKFKKKPRRLAMVILLFQTLGSRQRMALFYRKM